MDVKTLLGSNALQCAAEEGHTEVAKTLISAGANFLVKGGILGKETVLDFALKAGHKETAKAIEAAINKKLSPVSKKLKSLGF